MAYCFTLVICHIQSLQWSSGSHARLEWGRSWLDPWYLLLVRQAHCITIRRVEIGWLESEECVSVGHHAYLQDVVSVSYHYKNPALIVCWSGSKQGSSPLHRRTCSYHILPEKSANNHPSIHPSVVAILLTFMSEHKGACLV